MFQAKTANESQVPEKSQHTISQSSWCRGNNRILAWIRLIMKTFILIRNTLGWVCRFLLCADPFRLPLECTIHSSCLLLQVWEWNWIPSKNATKGEDVNHTISSKDAKNAGERKMQIHLLCFIRVISWLLVSRSFEMKLMLGGFCYLICFEFDSIWSCNSDHD